MSETPGFEPGAAGWEALCYAAPLESKTLLQRDPYFHITLSHSMTRIGITEGWHTSTEVAFALFIQPSWVRILALKENLLDIELGRLPNVAFAQVVAESSASFS